jgi:para-nitrobenzyl esterase
MQKSLLFACSIFFVGQTFSQVDCSGGRYYTPIFSNLDSAMNVVYGNADFGASNQDLKMDIWWPAGDLVMEKPLVILAHGGSFIGGTKSDPGMAEHCRWLASMGYVAASIDYRLGNAIDIILSSNVESTYVNIVYRAVHDQMASVRYFRENAAIGGNTYKIDPNLIIVGGFSAGSIMALHLTYMDTPAKLHPQIVQSDDGGFYGASGHPGYSVVPQAVLNYCGALADTIYVEAGDQPVMSIHGSADGTVPYGTAMANPGIPVMVVSGSGSIHKRALNVGVTNPLKTYWGKDHCQFWDTPQQSDTTYQFAADFLQDQLCIQHLYTEQHPNSVFFTAYPNPATTHMVIDIPGNDAEWNYSLTDLLGQSIKTGIIPSGQKIYTLNVEGLAPGMYVVSIYSGNRKASQKIMVK